MLFSIQLSASVFILLSWFSLWDNDHAVSSSSLYIYIYILCNLSYLGDTGRS